MAVYDLEEQEQLDELKAWWKQYGNLITGLVLVVSLGVLGWQGWTRYQDGQSAQASAVYSSLQQSIQVHDGQRVKASVSELLEKYSSSTYAPLGGLLAAKYFLDNNDAKTATAQLTWVVEHGKGELLDVARLRLAALQLDDKAYDGALKTLEAKPAAAFAPLYADLKGDILAAQGKKAEARGAYDEAITALTTLSATSLTGGQLDGNLKEVIQQKRDALGAAS